MGAGLLLNSPRKMIAAKLYRWSVDRLNGRFISGWCYHRLFKSRPVSIAIAADETVVGYCTNSGYRPDLVEKKLHSSGLCGFDFDFPADFDPGDHQRLLLFVDNHASPLVSIDCRTIEIRRPRLSNPVCFMHIPKTAGSSFNAFARTCFSADHFITHIERLDIDRRRQAARRAGYLSGHLPLYELTELIEPFGYSCFAIIREPYSHFHSHLNYVCGVAPASLIEHHYGYQHNETVKALSSRLNLIDFTDLDQVSSFVHGLRDYQLDFFDNMQTRYFLDYRPDRVGQEDFEQACANILRFTSVGLTESYDRFKNEFCRFIGVETDKQTLRSNRAKEYRLFDPAVQPIREALRPLVHYDLKLYEFVAGQFWGR
jgi:hypothetical protein